MALTARSELRQQERAATTTAVHAQQRQSRARLYTVDARNAARAKRGAIAVCTRVRACKRARPASAGLFCFQSVPELSFKGAASLCHRRCLVPEVTAIVPD